MPRIKATSFILELADLMSKYDVHFVIDDNVDSTDIWLVQNDWEPLEVPWDWHDGKITSDTVYNMKSAL